MCDWMQIGTLILSQQQCIMYSEFQIKSLIMVVVPPQQKVKFDTSSPEKRC
jgi:hypothetical protein